MRWIALRPEKAKPHVVDETLVESLASELVRRTGHGCAEEPATHYRFDEGGPVALNQPYHEMRLESGLVVSFACIDAYNFLRVLQRLPERMFDEGRRYYKVHGAYACLVLTPDERDEILQKLDSCKDEAYQRWRTFRETWIGADAADRKVN